MFIYFVFHENFIFSKEKQSICIAYYYADFQQFLRGGVNAQSTSSYPIKSKWGDSLGKVTISHNEGLSAVTVIWPRGFALKTIDLPGNHGPFVSQSMDDENYMATYTLPNVGDIGVEYFTATYDFIDEITDIKDLASIFRNLTPSKTGASISNNEITITESATIPSTLSSLNLNIPSVQVHLADGCYIKYTGQDYFIEINGGNILLDYEFQLSDGWNYFPNVKLNAGQLTVQGDAFCVRNMEMAGGKFIFGTDEPVSESRIENFSVSGGSIAVNETNLSGGFSSIKQLTINGNVEIEGKGEMTEGRNYYALADYITIEGGNVLLRKVGLSQSFKNQVIINGGQVTFEDITYMNQFPSSIEIPDNRAAVVLKDGTVTLQDSYLSINTVDDNNADYFIDLQGSSSLTIDGGYYKKAGEKSFFQASENASVVIKDGEFEYPFFLEKGTTTIEGGIFKDVFWIFHPEEAKDTQACFRLSKEAKLILKGGKFVDNAIYPEDPSTMNPNDLLASGYGFYTWDQDIQPDIQEVNVLKSHSINGTSHEYFIFGQVKPTSEVSPENAWLNEAKNANIGSEGTDVKMIPTENGYDYEVYTPKGLAWVASMYASVLDNGNLVSGLPGGEYAQERYQANVKIMADLDMSAHEWIPMSWSGNVFDGQGHSIRVKVRQSNAGFVSTVGDSSTLANLVVCGEITGVATDYTVKDIVVGGIATDNYGTIVNCGVQATVGCEAENAENIKVGGLVGNNYGSIENCYVIGNLTMKADFNAPKYRYYSEKFGDMRIAGLAINEYGTVLNSYYQGTLTANQPVCSLEGVTLDFNEIEQNPLVVPAASADESCTTDPTLDGLNQNVNQHQPESGEVAWALWIEKDGKLVHDNRVASSVTGTLKLQVEGNGKLEATYALLTDEETAEDVTIEALADKDTSVTFVVPKELVLKATPLGKDSLKQVLCLIDGQTEPVELEMVAEKEYAYTIPLGATITAYFSKTLVIESDTTVLGSDAEEINEYDAVSITKNESSDSLTVTLANVHVSQTMTVESGANATLSLSGSNQLETLVNNGTLTLTFEEASDEGNLEVGTTINSGTFTDLTGTITEVFSDGEEMPHLQVFPLEDAEVLEGSMVTLTASATTTGSVTFRWQRQNENGVWEDIVNPTTRAMLLRSASTTKTNQLVVSSEEVGFYRCLITYSENSVSTTLTTYAEVTLKSSEDPDTPDVSRYYDVKIEQVCDGVDVQLSKNRVKAGKAVYLLVSAKDGYQIDDIRVSYKNGRLGTWHRVNESVQAGKYIIYNVNSDIYIKIENALPTGIEDIKETKVYTQNGQICVYTPNLEKVQIISVSGILLVYKDQVGLNSYPASDGIYIVRVGNKVYKVKN